jgi:phage terminase small subunit
MITPKQQRFVDEYLVDLNATQAAIRAGYSKKTANEQGARLLANVSLKKLIADAMSKRSQATQITAERVLQELARVAFFDPRRLLNADGSPKPINELDDDTAAVLAGMDVSEEYEGSGEDRRFVGYTKKVKVSDKVAALGLAMRHLGMLNDKLQVGGGVTVKVKDYTGRKKGPDEAGN